MRPDGPVGVIGLLHSVVDQMIRARSSDDSDDLFEEGHRGIRCYDADESNFCREITVSCELYSCCHSLVISST